VNTVKLRRALRRWLYGRCPGVSGRFPYYGTTVYFPRGSLIFELACEQGVYEHENVKLLLAFSRPDSYVFDIGSNIGLMSVPLLHSLPQVRVASFEPSPLTYPYLERTWARSAFRSRWSISPKALAEHAGEIDFFVADAAWGVFDGTADTGRGGPKRVVRVAATTLDAEWTALGQPPVAAIKIDTEGSDVEVLMGGRNCLAAAKPYVILEWTAENLRVRGTKPESLIGSAAELGFSLYSTPGLVPIATESDLRLHMRLTETFVLSPR
jgi:FkbM family methyltransferase